MEATTIIEIRVVGVADLKAVCPTCGSVHEDVEALNATVARLAKENAGLRGQLTQMHRNGPLMEEIQDVFDYWVRRLGKRGDTVLGEARIKAVRARLKEGFTVERLKRAIDGCETDDWAMGRAPKTGGKTFNDLGKHVCLSDETVERFEKMATRQPVEQGVAVRRVLDRLEQRDLKVARSGNGWETQCPAHDDQISSLSVAAGDEGVLLCCQRGCPVEDIMASLGLPTAALFDDWRGDDVPPAPRKVTPPKEPDPLPSPSDLARWHDDLIRNDKALAELERRKGWTAATLKVHRVGVSGGRLIFPVLDGMGQLVTVARYRLNRRPGESKMLGLGGRPRNLFPAPESFPDRDWLWLVEGEPDALSGAELGLAAVALPGAGPASQGRLEEWAPRFAGRHVVVCLDCDDDGRACAARAVSALVGVAAEVRRVDLDPDRRDGFDLGDLLTNLGVEAARHAVADYLLDTEERAA
jgi:hypothetical protein